MTNRAGGTWWSWHLSIWTFWLREMPSSNLTNHYMLKFKQCFHGSSLGCRSLEDLWWIDIHCIFHTPIEAQLSGTWTILKLMSSLRTWLNSDSHVHASRHLLSWASSGMGTPMRLMRNKVSQPKRPWCEMEFLWMRQATFSHLKLHNQCRTPRFTMMKSLFPTPQASTDPSRCRCRECTRTLDIFQVQRCWSCWLWMASPATRWSNASKICNVQLALARELHFDQTQQRHLHSALGNLLTTSRRTSSTWGMWLPRTIRFLGWFAKQLICMLPQGWLPGIHLRFLMHFDFAGFRILDFLWGLQLVMMGPSKLSLTKRWAQVAPI